jgi:hypothetical protein
MPSLAQRVPVNQAASTTVPNILNGTNLQYVGLATKLTIWAAIFLAAAHDTFALSYSRGAEFGTVVPPGSTINNNPNGPQQLNDLLGTFPIPAGANLVLPVVSDATAGTHTGAFAFDLQS